MANMAELLEEEFKEAIIKQDEKAIKRVSIILGPAVEKVRETESDIKEIKSDIKTIAEILKIGFENTDKRLEDMNYHTNKRFEEINKRIEDMNYHTNKRFEEINKRIDETNKRIEDMQRQIDRLYKLFIFSTSFITAFILILRFLFPA